MCRKTISDANIAIYLDIDNPKLQLSPAVCQLGSLQQCCSNAACESGETCLITNNSTTLRRFIFTKHTQRQDHYGSRFPLHFSFNQNETTKQVVSAIATILVFSREMSITQRLFKISQKAHSNLMKDMNNYQEGEITR